jgi:VanZ family protein
MPVPGSRWFVSFGPAIGYMVLIWAVSSIPVQVDFSRIPFRDKGVHFTEYAMLGALLAHALRTSLPTRHALFAFVLAAFATILWGTIDEIHQAFVPGRNSDVRDLIADGLGAMFGAALYLIVRRQRERQRATRASLTRP